MYQVQGYNKTSFQGILSIGVALIAKIIESLFEV